MIAIQPLLAHLRFRFQLRQERGATAVEYAIMAGFVAAVVVFAVTALGTSTKGNFQSAATAGVH